MCSPTWKTHIPSDMRSPTWETHIPSDMYSLTRETHIPSDTRSFTWETHIPSGMCSQLAVVVSVLNYLCYEKFFPQGIASFLFLFRIPDRTICFVICI